MTPIRSQIVSEPTLRLRYTGYNGQTKNVISLPYNIFIPIN